MPSSAKFGKFYIQALLSAIHRARPFVGIVDVGCGEGTYRTLLGPLLPGARWTGVEVWEPYAARFDLPSLYDQLILSDARTVEYGRLGPLDLAVFGDMLEHMPKEDAVALVHRVLELAKMVVVSIPVVEYPQDPENDNPYERHVKDDWDHYEVMSSFAGISAFAIHDHIGVYVLTRDPALTAMVLQAQPQVGKMLRERFPDDRMAWGEWLVTNHLA